MITLIAPAGLKRAKFLFKSSKNYATTRINDAGFSFIAEFLSRHEKAAQASRAAERNRWDSNASYSGRVSIAYPV